jgi:predicted nuclease with RNAse H fold
MALDPLRGLSLTRLLDHLAGCQVCETFPYDVDDVEGTGALCPTGRARWQKLHQVDQVGLIQIGLKHQLAGAGPMAAGELHAVDDVE